MNSHGPREDQKRREKEGLYEGNGISSGKLGKGK
jgi:hypothetical protein